MERVIKNERMKNNKTNRTEKGKKPRNKKKVGKILLIVFGSILAAILLTVMITAIGNAVVKKSLSEYVSSFNKVEYSEASPQLIPQKSEGDYWTFTTDDEFKVVQLTDIHVGGGLYSSVTDKKALNAVASMVTAEKPDLVIATGDVAYPVPFAAGTANNKIAAKAFADLMETLGVYWTFTFGNHDTEVYSKYTREEMSDFYKSSGYKYCLFDEGPQNVDGCGNTIVKVKNSKGFITRAIVVLDSHSYLPDDKWGIKWHYDNIKTSQTEWYKKEMEKINKANETVFAGLSPVDKLLNIQYKETPSSLFFHIPLKEYKDAWTLYSANGNKDIPDKVELQYGNIGETGKLIFHGIGTDNVFDTVLEAGGDSIFCGHDHYNNISVEYWKKDDQIEPIRLTYGMSLDYLAYIGIAGKGTQRGCTVITYDGHDIDITPENYYQEKYTKVAKYKIEKVTLDKDKIPKKK